MKRKEAVVAQAMSHMAVHAWIELEGTGPRQSPRTVVCHTGDSTLGSVPSHKGQRSASVENRYVGLWGCMGGLALRFL